MSYQALYRKFRPDTFDKVVGQEQIVHTLKNEILSDMVSHAYLFCGTRGTGKTSTAKIFAKAINCLSPKDGEPCGKCELCKAMQEGRSVNVIEIDAASNNSVENIRDLREQVKYPPTEGKYKVYIIDEVHMLSSGAFNALLKTLEEPPDYVIFILATTETQKVPITILSRCQRFDFIHISSGEITKTLKKYVKYEKASADDSALATIARLADGSMRDSLSILDQCLAFYHDETITEEKVLDVCGATDNTVFFEMTSAIAGKKASKAMDIIDDIVYRGRDISQFTVSFLQHLRNLLVVSTVGESENVLDLSQETIKRLSVQAKKISPEEIIYYIRIFSQLISDMKYVSNKRILLEVEIIKLCSNITKNNSEYILSRLAELERKIKNGAFVVNTTEGTKTEKKTELKSKKVLPKAVPEDIQKVKKEWKDIVSGFEMPERSYLETTDIGYMDDGRLSIVCDEPVYKDLIENKKEVVAEKLEEKFQKQFEIKTVEKKDYDEYEKVTYGITNEDEEFDAFFGTMSQMFSDAEVIE